eukprot:RCo024326
MEGEKLEPSRLPPSRPLPLNSLSSTGTATLLCVCVFAPFCCAPCVRSVCVFEATKKGDLPSPPLPNLFSSFLPSALPISPENGRVGRASPGRLPPSPLFTPP